MGNVHKKTGEPMALRSFAEKGLDSASFLEKCYKFNEIKSRYGYFCLFRVL